MAAASGLDNNETLSGTPLPELLVIDAITIAAIVIFEQILKVEATKLIQYDRIELVKPEKRAELIADLEQRLGIKVLDVQVGGIDFLRDMAMLKITYVADDKGRNDVDHQTKIKKSQYEDM
jgi:hypothetical protein